MPRNRGYQGDNEPDNGVRGNRRNPQGSQGREQEVFNTDESNESIKMQPMAPGGPHQMQSSSYPQDPDNGLRDSQGREQDVLDGSQNPITMQPMASDGPYHMHKSSFPQGPISPGHQQQDLNAPGHLAPHDKVSHGYDIPGHAAPQGNVPHVYDESGNVYHGQSVPGQLVPQGPMAPGYNHAPHIQGVMKDEESQYDGYMPSMVSIIIRRLVTVAVLIFNETLNWLKYFDWMGTVDLPAMFGYFGKKGKVEAIECSPKAPFLPTIYGIFCGIATVFALFQIINTIGETLLDYHQTKNGPNDKDVSASQGGLPQNNDQTDTVPQDRSLNQSEKEITGIHVFRGFQLLHGWVETVAAMVVEDIPQIIVIAASSYYCTVNVEDAVFLFIWYIVKVFKNGFRISFCKQKYKPCILDCDKAKDRCCSEWCTWTCPLPCCCIILVSRQCPVGDEPRCETQPMQICPDCEIKSVCPDKECCSGPRICAGLCQARNPKDKDPEWATELLKKLDMLFEIGGVAVVVLQILGFTKTYHASL
ncbi:uncharacterized protein LOC128244552 [Mya arenaria]|uniref:uncharacterized protein LOC128244552 n=1 Tax=Mya arenaria TaxID=6604 RepID=UPI0022E52B45|nr:uncharacterized protein LOC128244552 [Mya arenaria]